MEIITVAKTTAPNPYAGDVESLIAATETNELAAGSWTVDLADLGKTTYKIQRAANDVGRTASIVSETPSKDGKQVTIVARIKPKHKSGPRGPRTPKGDK